MDYLIFVGSIDCITEKDVIVYVHLDGFGISRIQWRNGFGYNRSVKETKTREARNEIRME